MVLIHSNPFQNPPILTFLQIEYISRCIDTAQEKLAVIIHAALMEKTIYLKKQAGQNAIVEDISKYKIKTILFFVFIFFKVYKVFVFISSCEWISANRK